MGYIKLLLIFGCFVLLFRKLDGQNIKRIKRSKECQTSAPLPSLLNLQIKPSINIPPSLLKPDQTENIKQATQIPIKTGVTPIIKCITQKPTIKIKPKTQLIKNDVPLNVLLLDNKGIKIPKSSIEIKLGQNTNKPVNEKPYKIDGTEQRKPVAEVAKIDNRKEINPAQKSVDDFDDYDTEDVPKDFIKISDMTHDVKNNKIEVNLKNDRFQNYKPDLTTGKVIHVIGQSPKQVKISTPDATNVNVKNKTNVMKTESVKSKVNNAVFNKNNSVNNIVIKDIPKKNEPEIQVKNETTKPVATKNIVNTQIKVTPLNKIITPIKGKKETDHKTDDLHDKKHKCMPEYKDTANMDLSNENKDTNGTIIIEESKYEEYTERVQVPYHTCLNKQDIPWFNEYESNLNNINEYNSQTAYITDAEYETIRNNYDNAISTAEPYVKRNNVYNTDDAISKDRIWRVWQNSKMIIKSADKKDVPLKEDFHEVNSYDWPDEINTQTFQPVTYDGYKNWNSYGPANACHYSPSYQVY